MNLTSGRSEPDIGGHMFFDEKSGEKTLLVSLDTGGFDAYVSIDELEQLAQTAGANVIGKLIQKKDAPDTATFIGLGKLAEVIALCEKFEVELIIFDCELSPSQQRNIENLTRVRVIDRTMLILDIFAASARSSEGKLQVELAQLKYRLPRLGGQGQALSRLGGGIGTRGPGETKLETDRRHIQKRIDKIEAELEGVRKRREMLRRRREKNRVTTVAIVGYTNAGKSTLMNALTGAGVLTENKLFATLDPTSRSLRLPDGRDVMLIDTVGLIRRLPTKLIEAFKSTLEVAVDADVILNVCDASDEHAGEHLEVTKRLLVDLGCDMENVVTVMNKCDTVGDIYSLPTFGSTVMISALEGRGLDKLLQAVQDALPGHTKRVCVLFPYTEGGKAAFLRSNCVLNSEEYREDGLFMDVTARTEILDRIKPYII